MDFEIYNYTGFIGEAPDLSNKSFKDRSGSSSEPAYFLELLGCDIQESKGIREKSGIANYSYSVYIPMDDDSGLGLVKYDGAEMTMKQYLSIEDKKEIKEGCYFKGIVEGKEVNGMIVFYMPNQLGCKLGIIDIDV